MKRFIFRRMRISSLFVFLVMFVFWVSSAGITEAAQVANSFAFPVGYPDATGYSILGWDFLDDEGNVYHPGEDWNGVGGGDTDLGDPVYAIANGTVVNSGAYGVGWGNIIVIEHTLPDTTKVWSVYAHLDVRSVVAGWDVEKGREIGTIGKGHNNEYAAHLHFEIRKQQLIPNYWPTGQSIQEVQAKYHHPTDFINSHQNLTQFLTYISPDTTKIYWIQNSKKYHVINETVLNTMQNAAIQGWNWSSVYTVSTSYTQAPEFISTNSSSNGLLIKLDGGDDVYLINNGQKEHISYEAFIQAGYDWNDIIDVPQVILDMFSDDPPLFLY